MTLKRPEILVSKPHSFYIPSAKTLSRVPLIPATLGLTSKVGGSNGFEPWNFLEEFPPGTSLFQTQISLGVCFLTAKRDKMGMKA
jgi:hypothetical protein